MINGDSDIGVICLRLEQLQATLDEVREDVRELTRASLLLRITQLEEWKQTMERNRSKLLIGATLAVIGAWAAAIVTLITAR